jgi:hypothetical protein
MARISNSATIARAVADLAARQHGVIARRQLRHLGLTDDAILAAGPRRRGGPCLRKLLAARRPVAETVKYPIFRSLFEAKLLPLLAAADLAHLISNQVGARRHLPRAIS